MKPIELAEKTKIPKSSISQYMSGYAKPNGERIYLISDALNVNEAWLLGFDSQMDKVSSDNNGKINLSKMTAQEIIEEEYQKLYEKLDLEDKAEIRGTMKQMLKADKYKINTNDTPSLSALRLINNRSDDDGYSQAASNLKYKKKSK